MCYTGWFIRVFEVCYHLASVLSVFVKPSDALYVWWWISVITLAFIIHGNVHKRRKVHWPVVHILTVVHLGLLWNQSQIEKG
jgi:hypothetical protein